MRRRTILIIGALGLAFVALRLMSPGRPKTAARGQAVASVSLDVVYRKVGDAELKLDLARPAEGRGPFPVVLLIHGGGWHAGRKEDLRGALGAYAARGYVAVAPQYRLAPAATFPAQLHDVKAAVRWIKAHARQYDADPDRVGALGISAGAHLALLLGLTGPDDGLEGDVPAGSPDAKVRAIISIGGPTDLVADDFPPSIRDAIADFLGAAPGAAARASPVTYVSAGDAPVLAFHGTEDGLVPPSQATELAEALTATGVPGRVKLLPGVGHVPAGKDLARVGNETIEFLDRHLKGLGP
jgi:acetyl esterase/lipase